MMNVIYVACDDFGIEIYLIQTWLEILHTKTPCSSKLILKYDTNILS